MKTGIWKRIGDFWKGLDPSSKPAFFMFLVVLAAAGGLNYVGLSPVVGDFLAIAIALFFGVGVLSWHIVEGRTDDSEEQEDIAQVVKWLNVILDGCLIVINLFRADLRSINAIDGMTVWDTSAFIIIGVSAGSHVIGFLLWNQNDTARKNRKELQRSMSTLSHKGERANIAMKRTEARMMKIKWIEEESVRLRNEYGNVPGIDAERMIRAMKKTALAEFDDIAEQDVEETKTNKPATKQMETVYGVETERPNSQSRLQQQRRRQSSLS